MARIDQFIIEVHEVNNRCEMIKSKLEAAGFQVFIDQDPLYIISYHAMFISYMRIHPHIPVGVCTNREVIKLMNIYTVWAKRPNLNGVTPPISQSTESK
jgi:hypothetical protein